MKKVGLLVSSIAAISMVNFSLFSLAACKKEEKPEVVPPTFSVSDGQMESETVGTIYLDWEPSEDTIDFSLWTFSSSVAQIKSIDPVTTETQSGSLELTLTFQQNVKNDITDGKLGFHYKDTTSTAEGDKSISNIHINRFEPEPEFAAPDSKMLDATTSHLIFLWQSQDMMDFDNFTFTYDNGTKSAEVTEPQNISFEYLILTFDEPIVDEDITDGVLSFNYTDETTNSNGSSSIENITIKKYVEPTRIIVSLVAGEHGQVDQTSISLDNDKQWGEIEKQITVTPDEGCAFNGWYDEHGKKLRYDFTVSHSFTATAKFVTDPIKIETNIVGRGAVHPDTLYVEKGTIWLDITNQIIPTPEFGCYLKERLLYEEGSDKPVLVYDDYPVNKNATICFIFDEEEFPTDNLIFAYRDNKEAWVVGYKQGEGIPDPVYVEIPNTVDHDGEQYKVTTISGDAFANCKTLESVDLPSNMKKIGDRAFIGCASLDDGDAPTFRMGFTYHGSFEQWQHILFGKDWHTGAKSKQVNCDDGRFDLDTFSSLFDFDFNGSGEDIYATVDEYKGDVQNVIIPFAVQHDGKFYPVKRVGDNSFDYENITSISVPDTVTLIETEAFIECKVKRLYFPSSLKEIHEYACSNLSRLNDTSGDDGRPGFTFYGTIAQWKKVSRQKLWHYGSTGKATKIHCNDGDCKLDAK